MTFLSVVICTLNRAPVLKVALDSFYAMTGSCNDEIELWIIDNHSTDGTAALIAEFTGRVPNLHYAYEGRLGLAHARNAGARVARGALVAYVDDDVLFDPGWLTAVRQAVDEHPDTAAFGGRSIPVFEAPRPDWLSDDLLGIFGSTGSGERAKIMAYPECPFGLNMVLRRETLQQIGDFNPALGRQANKLLSNDETEYFLRVASAELCVRYAPGVLLYHRIPATRMTSQWVRSRYYWQGISDATLAQLQRPRSRAGLLKRAVDDAWELFAEICANRLWRARARRLALSSPAAGGFHLANRLGRIHGRLKQARRSSPVSTYGYWGLRSGGQKSGVAQ